ncbi:hypothetical protein [Oceanobacillus jeddahense]|uniref:Uncharacterized protein n=1 Tax=Oceanobacillus jeddahense TaxID=1462527 RepID=A0ABY5JWN4_9BACI|nr:hypothetical protein [Oceanobacillus jeddahense]UUI04790.1 hypothetical protein NP439_09200 [Oceanobacillus jeddahense]
MIKEDNQKFLVYFTEGFNRWLDPIQAFFSEQEEDVFEWCFFKEGNMIDVINILPSRSKRKRIK